MTTTTADLDSPPASSGSGLVRVSVVAADRRADLALPAALPVAELLPELTRALGVLDPQTTYAGYVLCGPDGRALSPESGLSFQGIEDGALLTLVVGAAQQPPKVYDDIVEAMADAVEAQTRPWDAASARRTALVTAGLLLGLGGLSLALQRPDVVAGAAAGVGAVVLATAAVVLSRVRGEHAAAVMLAWLGVGFGAVCGLTAAPAGPLLEVPLALAGLGALSAGLVGLAGIAEKRAAMVPAVVVGAVCAASSGLLTATAFEAAHVYTAALVLVVLAGSALPWFAIGSTPTRVEQAYSAADVTSDPVEIDPRAVRRDALAGHDLLLAITATVGLLALLVAPMAVGLGVSGTLVVVASGLVLMLRTRQYRVESEVGAGLGFGVAGFVAVVVSSLVQHPGWRATLALVLAVTSTVLLVLTLVPLPPSVRRGRVGDIAELVALVALPTLLVLALDVVGTVRG
ncbi:MAG: type VII secretion integral membrane protein EccD [Marmoricola sp.]